MRRMVLACCLAAAVLGGSQAAANPVSLDAFRLRQVPGTQHVPVTYAVSTDAGGGGTTINGLQKDGAPLAVSWTDVGSFRANTGSGLEPLNGWQTCDCDVELGQHSYAVEVQGGACFGGPCSPDSSVNVVADLSPPNEADAGAVELPWNIPEPAALQGLDCVATCAGTGHPEPMPDSGGAADAGGGADPGAAPTVTDDDDSGCSAGRGLAPWLWATLMLLLFGAVRQRD